ncbi:MAG: hypothetical protein UY13_C0002G0172 [Candidatus Pacebacteria bacterium GW2011_GWB1_47_8]|nr:MAG: hypothetical protein UX28_C0001G0321 [Candidatus Pacebacteria bacterium GW2011_GWA1_46_10]KKU84260.1 MAG: hypothetical protein UY13_C0002G0172 [Candidatus Pacebacteria bacterium GW2011_GWB1_47_8]HCR81480.1 hypothetical protein [Candidatus Paceibacterota bacterium]
MPKPLILFDIDKTLIDTDRLRALLKQNLAQLLGRSEDEVADAFLEYGSNLPDNTAFHPEELLKLFSQRFHTPIEPLRDAFYEPSRFQQALYPEVVDVLSKLRHQGYTLGLYSQGELAWQEHKMLANNLLEFFDKNHRYIKREKADPAIIENLPENTIIIDDKPGIIAFLETFPHVIPLHIVRERANHVGEYTLSTLNDLLPILDSLRNSGSSQQ